MFISLIARWKCWQPWYWTCSTLTVFWETGWVAAGEVWTEIFQATKIRGMRTLLDGWQTMNQKALYMYTHTHHTEPQWLKQMFQARHNGTRNGVWNLIGDFTRFVNGGIYFNRRRVSGLRMWHVEMITPLVSDLFSVMIACKYGIGNICLPDDMVLAYCRHTCRARNCFFLCCQWVDHNSRFVATSPMCEFLRLSCSLFAAADLLVGLSGIIIEINNNNWFFTFHFSLIFTKRDISLR